MDRQYLPLPLQNTKQKKTDMIHSLLTYCKKTLLIPGFDGYGQAIDIQVGHPTAETDISLLMGPLEVSQQVKDRTSTEPQPQPMRESFVFAGNSYTLAKVPIKGTLMGAFVLDESGKKERLDEGEDFKVDYMAKILTLTPSFFQYLTETYHLEEAHILLQYSFVGVVTLREFEQEFTVDIKAATYAEVEKMASLVTTILLTNQQQALAAVNPSAYNLEAYQSIHILHRYHWLGGELVAVTDDKYKYQLSFQVQGQLKSIKATPDMSYDTIKSVLSPGVERDDDWPVNVEVDLG